MKEKENVLDMLNKADEDEKEKIFNEYKQNQDNDDKKSQRRFLGFVLAIFIIFKFIILNGIIPSGSMEPGLKDGDSIIVNRLSYTFKDPERLDIIVFKEEGSYVIKRVIGMPGDEIAILDGDVYINGSVIQEDYLLKEKSTYVNGKGAITYSVPNDSYFVLGDNRENSLDSRYWDNPYLEKDMIVGKLMFKYKLPRLFN